MQAGIDEAHGAGGRDDIYGGDNSQTYRETLWGGDGQDYLYDQTGPDKDRLCGGDGEDFFDMYDGDGLDVFRGDTNPSGHEDKPIGIGYNNGDDVSLDGVCS